MIKEGLKASTAPGRARRSGIDLLGDLPWGTHFCQFYQTEEELLDVVLPYLRAGLEGNEFCLWIVCDPLSEHRALQAMRDSMPDFYRHHAKGQMEILPHRVWYVEDGSFNLRGVLNGQGHRAIQALGRGYDGVRVAINVSWLNKKSWKSFADYEAESNQTMSGHPIISFCSYPLAKCGIPEVLDVMANHQFALIKRLNKWQVLSTLGPQETGVMPGGSGGPLSAPAIAPRRHDEKPLSELEERLSILFELAPDAYYLSTLESTFVDGNKAAEELTGYKREELIGKNFLELNLLSGDQIAKGAELLAQNARGLPTGPDELVLTRKDGTRVNLEINTLPVKIGGRELVLGIARDITQRKEAEQTLRAREGLLQNIIETTSDCVWEVDQNGIYTYVSPRIREILGYEPEEVLGKTPFDLMPPDEAARVNPLFSTIATSQKPFTSLENINVHKRGYLVVLETSGVPIFDDIDGGFCGYRGIERDITERKKAQDALRDSEEHYRLLAENLSDVIWTIDTTTMKYTYMSPSITRLRGYTVEEAMDQKLEETMTPQAIETAMRIIAEEDIKERSGQHDPDRGVTLDLEMRCKDGSTTWVENRVTYIRDAEGKITTYLGVSRDVTERRLMEHQVKERLKELHVLFGLSAVNEREGITLDGLYQEAANILPKGWQYPEIACARIVIGDSEFRTNNFAESPWKQSAPLKVNGAIVGRVEVAYLEERPELHEGPFLAEERLLTNAVAERLGHITERKQAENALAASEEHYRLLADNMTDSIWVTDMDMRPVYMSPSYQRLTGYTTEEAMHRGMADSLTPASLNAAAAAFERAMAAGEADGLSALALKPLELEMIRKDGSIVWVSTTLSPIRDAEGRLVQIMGVLHDITERKLAEEMLGRLSHQHELILRSAAEGILGLDLQGNHMFVNPAAASMLGYEVKELLGHRAHSTWHHTKPDGSPYPAEECDIAAAHREGKVHRTSTEIFWRKDGTSFPVEYASTPIYERGRPVGVVLTFTDITERKRAIDELRVSEERFRGLVESTTDIVWETDRRGICRYVSAGTVAVLGYDPEELLGKSLLDLMSDCETGGRFAQALRSKAASREPFKSLEAVVSRRDGRPVALETSGVPVFNQHGRLLGYRGIARDITERREANRRLEQTLDKLRRTMEGTIQAVTATVEWKDPFTAGHQRRVAELACAIAQEMGLSAERIQVIRMAGLLHDIGKIAVPTEILAKPGRLSDIEMALIRSHCEVGYNILKGVEFPWPIADMVVQHHERIDGSGYPFGIREEAILIEARVLGVADVVEAMTAHRPYRKAPGVEMALGEIATNSGRLYDTDVVYACLRLFRDKRFEFADSGSNWINR